MVPYAKATLVFLIASLGNGVAARRLVGNRFNYDDGGSHQELVEVQPQDMDIAPLEEIPVEPQQESLIAAQFTKDPYASRDKMEMLQTGELSLAGLRYVPTSFAINGDDTEAEGLEDDMYNEVYGEFCVFDASLNKVDPSYYPTVKDVMGESEHCGEHRYTMPLRVAMETIANEDKGSGVRSLPLSGMLFHQGYSGAGLISNALTVFDSALVISEHSALHDALAACDVIRNRYKSDNCSADKQRALVRDIITLLSRTSNTNVEHLYLKLDSSSAAYLPTLTSMYPTAQWTFSYRNPQEILSKNMERKRSVTCVKAKRNPTSALANKSSENNLDLEHLSKHEVCALHLSTLLEMAVLEHETKGTGMLVSYDDIVTSSNGAGVIVEEVLPYLGLEGEINTDTSQKVTEVLSKRSNARNNKKGVTKEWDVSQEKNIEITDEVRAAVKVFMGGVMGGS